MKHKISLEKLKGVPRTLLIPLRGRYLETKRTGGIINDPKSVEIIDRIAHDFEDRELPWVGQVMISTRTEIFDQAVKKFLAEFPDSVVINLGCGLDTRVHRIDNGKVLWFDLDLAECIELRKNFFAESGRFKFIAKSVLDFSWVEQIPKDKTTLFIAEGLLNYFDEDDVRSIIFAIKDNFPNSEIIFEAYSDLVKKSWHKSCSVGNAFSMFKWCIDSGKTMETWDKGIIFLKELYYVDRHPKRWKWMRFFRCVRPLRRLLKAIHLRFEPVLK